MVTFVLLALGLLGLYIRLHETTVARRAIQALALSWIGVGLTLSYYGAETFGVHAIGQEAIKEKNPGLLSLVNAVRLEEGIVFFITGLLFLAAGTILFAIAIWRSSSLPTWIGIPLAIGTIHPSTLRAAVDQGSSRTINHDCIHLIAWSMLKRKEVVGRT